MYLKLPPYSMTMYIKQANQGFNKGTPEILKTINYAQNWNNELTY